RLSNEREGAKTQRRNLYYKSSAAVFLTLITSPFHLQPLFYKPFKKLYSSQHLIYSLAIISASGDFVCSSGVAHVFYRST
ncbi:hypothetical protein, partial [Pseudomonas aeruginosa]|uniref:hypothetical protein n=1 Tax=Pseudomonas aeruginosa TaxID=287 RepID=UPI002B4086E6